MDTALSLVILLTISTMTWSAVAAEKSKPPPSDLAKLLATPMLAKDASHAEQRAFLHVRIPPLERPDSAADWDAEANALRQRMLDKIVMKGHDPAVLTGKPGVEWFDTIETGRGYRIRKLRYEGYPGMWIPALLYEPTELAGRVPVVLNPNGHERPAGKAAKYKQLRCINQAKRGMIALNPEWIAMGELRRAGYDHYELAYLDLCGQAGVGVFYMLLKRGLDVLLDHPHADPSRVAVTGLSGGGWQTIFFSSLDTRVKLAAPNAGYIGQTVRYEHGSDIGDLEQCPVDQLTVADYTHLTAMLAPRPALLIYNVRDNCCFVSERARPSVYDPVIPFYELYGQHDRFGYHENKDPGDHNYKLDNRQQFYRFAGKWFIPKDQRRDEEIPSDDEVKTREQLSVGVPKDNVTFYTLAERAAAGLPREPLPKTDTLASIREWCALRRAALRQNLRIAPTSASVVEARELSGAKYAAKALKIKISQAWHVPAVDVALKGKTSKRVAVVVADGGRQQAESLVGDLLDDGHRVIAVDVLLTGQCRPVGFSVWQVAMCMGNVGGRPLGVQVTQLLAVIDWAAKAYPDLPITVAGVGRTSSVAAVLAAGLSQERRPAMLVTVGLPASLKLLIEKRIKYQDAPCLFSFGLLTEADVCEMLALALPSRVRLIQTEGAKKRIATSLAPFARLASTAGQPGVDLSQKAYGAP